MGNVASDGFKYDKKKSVVLDVSDCDDWCSCLHAGTCKKKYHYCAVTDKRYHRTDEGMFHAHSKYWHKCQHDSCDLLVNGLAQIDAGVEVRHSSLCAVHWKLLAKKCKFCNRQAAYFNKSKTACETCCAVRCWTHGPSFAKNKAIICDDCAGPCGGKCGWSTDGNGLLRPFGDLVRSLPCESHDTRLCDGWELKKSEKTPKLVVGLKQCWNVLPFNGFASVHQPVTKEKEEKESTEKVLWLCKECEKAEPLVIEFLKMQITRFDGRKKGENSVEVAPATACEDNQKTIKEKANNNRQAKETEEKEKARQYLPWLQQQKIVQATLSRVSSQGYVDQSWHENRQVQVQVQDINLENYSWMAFDEGMGWTLKMYPSDNGWRLRDDFVSGIYEWFVPYPTVAPNIRNLLDVPVADVKVKL
jgi:hypothetical protein